MKDTEEVKVYDTPGEREKLNEKYDDILSLRSYAPILIADYNESLYGEFQNIEEVMRLTDISQLGLAAYTSIAYAWHGNRFQHSVLNAAKLDQLFQTHEQLDESERELAVAVGMLHDIASTPYSDSVAIPLELDDQENFEKVLENSEVASKGGYLDKHGIDKKRLIKLIEGKDDSPLGQLTSSKESIDVDRWSYITIDSALKGIGFNREFIDPFESMRVIDGDIVFEDVQEVKKFLQLRAEMFDEVYKNKKLRAKEAFFGKIIKKFVYGNEFGLKEMDMFEWTDEDLHGFLVRNGKDLEYKIFGVDGFTLYGRFDASEEELNRFLSEHTDSKYVLEEDYSIHDATGTLVVCEDEEGNEEVKKFSEVEKESTAIIKERLEKDEGIILYGQEGDEDLKKANKKAKRDFEVLESYLEDNKCQDPKQNSLRKIVSP